MSKRVEMFTLYERIWHWLQAITVLLLMITGMQIHWPEIRFPFSFLQATWVHEILAIFTIANAFLSFFYHLSTGAIRQFIPRPADFFSMAIVQTKYYLFGIFRGDAHPFAHGPNNKLNVIQQITYLFVLNVVLPLQVLSGVVMWKAHVWQDLVEKLGGLKNVAGVHIICAWFFAAFLIGHIYMATTGRTPTSLTKAMVVGYEEVEEDPGTPNVPPSGSSHTA
jgi:Ni/Fe-hydrogenase b-type cytochrome subunit